MADFESLIALTLHELTHGLILNADYFSKFRDPMTGSIVEEEDVKREDEDGTFWVISPEVAAVAKDHFDCDSLPGVMLDDEGYHWNGRMLNTEMMNSGGTNPFSLGRAHCVSHDANERTLAFSDDSESHNEPDQVQ